MFKIKNIIALLISLFLCFLVGCTGDPAQEVEQHIYNTTFRSDQSTQSTSKITQIKTSNDETITEVNESTIKDIVSSYKVTKHRNKKNKNIKNNANLTTKNKVVVIAGNNDNSNLKQNVTVVGTTKISAVKTAESAVENTTTKVITTTETTTTVHIDTTTLAPLKDDEICYVTANGEKYHRQGCRYLNRSCIEIIVEEAKEQGYTPCKVCKP